MCNIFCVTCLKNLHNIYNSVYLHLSYNHVKYKLKQVNTSSHGEVECVGVVQTDTWEKRDTAGKEMVRLGMVRL